MARVDEYTGSQRTSLAQTPKNSTLDDTMKTQTQELLHSNHNQTITNNYQHETNINLSCPRRHNCDEL